MVKLGDVARGDRVGRKSKDWYVWSACPVCKLERWIRTTKPKSHKFTGLCHRCNAYRQLKECPKQRGENHWQWKGGRGVNVYGYITITLQPDDFFYPTASQRGCILEHRLVMARHIGRNLHRWEMVHHKGIKYPKGSIENRQDNRIENLQLVTGERHQQITILENRISYLEKRVKKLETEIKWYKGK